jgi:hypothetical protein
MIEWGRSPDFIGLRNNCFRPLCTRGFVAILFPVDHHLGDSENQLAEFGAPRLFCFTAGFSGSPNGVLCQALGRHSNRVHKPAVNVW